MVNSDYKILIVDDVKANIHLLGSILNREGYRVSAANSGEKALTFLKKNSVDLILLDVMMPEMDGFEVCEKLKKDDDLKHIPVIFVTAKAEDEDVAKGFECGGEDYILKPIKKLEVLKRVSRTLERVYVLNLLNGENNFKNNLISILSHDLRGPINNIVATIDFYKNNILSEQDTLSFIHKLGDSAKATSTLLDNVLTWVNSQNRVASITLAPFDIEEIIVGIEHYQEKALFDKSIAFSYHVDLKEHIVSDREIISIIIRNLVSNSIKFTESNGEITINVFEDDTFIHIVVQDNGVGIDEHSLHSILNTDSHFSTTGTRKEVGTGLGLNMCQNYAKSLGATFEVISKLGKGTKTKISLPIRS